MTSIWVAFNNWARKRGVRRAAVASLALAFTCLAVFQNCGPSPRVQALFNSKPIPEKLTAGNYCTHLSPDTTVIYKYLFVVDMSLSNIGQTVKATNLFNFGLGTDVDGKRFDELEKFLSSPCASSPQNRFQVQIFSNQAGVPGSLSCSTPFGTAQQAHDQLETARKLQTDAVTFFKPFTTQTFTKQGLQTYNQSIFMKLTNYSAALDCLKGTMDADHSANPTDTSNYVVFFLTDGQPHEPAGQACETDPKKFDCYAKVLGDKSENMKIDQKVIGEKLQIYPFFYQGSATSSGAAEAANAEKVLLAIGQPTGVPDVKKLGDVSGADGGTSLSDAMCALSSASRQIDYRKELLSIVNLTAKPVGDKLMADSDMDGISDEDELRLGYDPTNPRTFGLLDSVCELLGGPTACKTALSKITCSGSANNLGLLDCDLIALGLTLPPKTPIRQFGIDTDRDGIPDLVELLRGTNPTLADADHDTDADGFTNLQEINQGTDVERPTVNLPSNYVKMRYTETLDTSGTFCSEGSEGWSFHIDDLPVVPTLAFTSTVVPAGVGGNREAQFDASQFSHRADENVILLTYKLTPVNADQANPQLWGAILKVRVGASPDGRYKPQYNSLQPSDFYYLGDLR